MSNTRETTLSLAILLPALIAIVISLSSCTVSASLEYNGKTGKDNRTLSPEFVQGIAKQARY